MAVEMMTWARREVFPSYDLNGSERFILFLLADNASWSDEVREWYAYPHLKTLVTDSGFSQSTVQRALSKFVDLGLVSVHRRYRPTGAPAGNGYILHPDAVENSVALSKKKPGNTGVVTMTSPENSRVVTMTSLSTPGEASPVDNSQAPRDGESGHHDQSPLRVVTMTTGGGHHDHSRAGGSGDVRALTVNEPSSSSTPSSTTGRPPSALGGDDDDDSTISSKASIVGPAELGTHAGVDLDRVAGQLRGRCAATLTRDRLVWVVEAILARSRRGRPGNPGQYVARALEMSGDEWAAVMADEFTDRTSGDREKRTPERRCPIQHHADSGWTARTCPGCRKQLDFPRVLDRSIYEALEPDVRSLIDRDQTVTVVDTSATSVRSHDRDTG